ncbi:cyclohexa-1,5-dienecarbonyl-CoA hydratase [Rhodomicrobium lacus]|uniref:cyclohexa-1,5-dienecarbonyl-CoA hydratase n=1 Tax=Rhodomicrobium lacus TaxID=2498452 RepID=UPI0026E2ECB4|nr:cyclohexa-1,5-dienecarbonyl-CoA hydratase [Rhodomicrobium lacus]WKW51261.1 cyclohexa-1,5-dienecarbonyl-CoA hydratase [Rhodomicrobium lacus]
MTIEPLKVWHDRDGKLLRLRLARPKANIVDAQMIAALTAALDAHMNDPAILAVLIDHEGPHFSFGASVQEHLPDQCDAMLKSFNALVMRLVAAPVPVLVAVRGQCLGGGMEVAIAGSRIFAAPDAKFGQPEIVLGVFAPPASCILPEKIARAAAEDILLSGRSISGEQAFALGLVSEITPEPEAAALSYFDHALAGLSPSSLRIAVKAARLDMVERVRTKLCNLEHLYLEKLMSTKDALEGLTAFIEKRPAQWEAR